MIKVQYGTVEIVIHPIRDDLVRTKSEPTVRRLVTYVEADVHRAVTMALAAMRRASPGLD